MTSETFSHARAVRGLAVCALLLAVAVPAEADWPTHRGSAQRTGCVDDQPGPKAPCIKWAHKAREDYVAAPLPEGSAVYVPTLGPFNTGLFQCLTAQNELPRVHWAKIPPFIKRPVVCAPVSTEGLILFGDGMHQTDDAILYCLLASTGMPVWQYPVPGKLVHLEASPTVDKGRVYVGGGAAGVLCLDLKRVILDKQEMDLAASQALIEQKRKEMIDAAARDGNKGLGYNAGPNDDLLPKPAPKLIWQSGKDRLHVDSPVAVVGDSVLVASAFLDEEKIGKRALVCLRTSDGGVAWETPLELNPWAGATAAGNKVLVGCSNIRFDVDTIKNGKGEVVAVELATGKVAWRKSVPGGVLSTIAAKDGLAIFTATDGKVRAWKVDSGEEQWLYDAKRPFFAGPAVAAGVVYAADLNSVVHAIKLTDGQTQWTFDAANAAGAQLPGMVYGSPVVSRGRIYLTTCNIQGDHVGAPCMVACIGDKQTVAASAKLTIDMEKRTISIPCNIAPRKLPTLADIYPLEVIACHPAPIGQKAHETIVTTEVKPSELYAALVQLGLKPGVPARGLEGEPTGPEVRLLLEFPDLTGRPRTMRIEDVIADALTGRGILPLKWRFTDATPRHQTGYNANRDYAADLSGTLITLFPITAETVIQSTQSMKSRAVLNLDTRKDILPPEGTPARLIVALGDTPVGERTVSDRGAGTVSDSLRPHALAKPVDLRQTPLPFTPLSVPEPSRTPSRVKLDAPAADFDAPVRSLIPAQPVPLPAKK